MTRGRAAARRAAHRRGRLAEAVAAVLLLLKGYRILAWRYAGGGGEIDLVARRGRLVVFVEVKARADLDAARNAIGGVKRARLSRAARHWLARHPWAAPCSFRGDAVFLAPRRWPRHVPGAFELLV